MLGGRHGCFHRGAPPPLPRAMLVAAGPATAVAGALASASLRFRLLTPPRARLPVPLLPRALLVPPPLLLPDLISPARPFRRLLLPRALL